MNSSLHNPHCSGAPEPAPDESTPAADVPEIVALAEGDDPKQAAAGERSSFVPLRSERNGTVAPPGEFAHLLPTRKTLLTPGEVARLMGRSTDYIYDLIHAGELAGHGTLSPGKRRYLITTQSVLLHLARSACYDPAAITGWIDRFIDSLKPDQLSRLAARAAAAAAAPPGEEPHEATSAK